MPLPHCLINSFMMSKKTRYYIILIILPFLFHMEKLWNMKMNERLDDNSDKLLFGLLKSFSLTVNHIPEIKCWFRAKLGQHLYVFSPRTKENKTQTELKLSVLCVNVTWINDVFFTFRVRFLSLSWAPWEKMCCIKWQNSRSNFSFCQFFWGKMFGW